MKTRLWLAINTRNQFKNCSQRILTEFSKTNCESEGLDTFTKKIRETESIDQRHACRRLKHARTEERDHWMNWNLLNQEGQKQTHRSTRHVSKKTGLTQCSIVQIIHRYIGLKCLVY